MRLVFVDRLCHDKSALRAAYTHAQTLIANKWNDWPAPSWDEPAVLAFDGDVCVAGVNWSVDEKLRKANVDFAFCTPTHPKSFAACLLALRRKLAETNMVEVSFACHPDNAPMMKLISKLRLRPQSVSFRIKTSDILRPA